MEIYFLATIEFWRKKIAQSNLNDDVTFFHHFAELFEESSGWSVAHSLLEFAFNLQGLLQLLQLFESIFVIYIKAL